MKYIEIDEELYRYIASKTLRIGESASDILRRELGLSIDAVEQAAPQAISHPSLESSTDVIEAVVLEKAEEVVSPEAELSFNHLLNENLLQQQKGAVGRFLFGLESIHKLAGQNFSRILQIQGRDRLYFATSKDALLEVSPSANPKEIGTSGYWVTSNNNTAKKRAIFVEVLLKFGCDDSLIESISEQLLPQPQAKS